MTVTYTSRIAHVSAAMLATMHDHCEINLGYHFERVLPNEPPLRSPYYKALVRLPPGRPGAQLDLLKRTLNRRAKRLRAHRVPYDFPHEEIREAERRFAVARPEHRVPKAGVWKRLGL